MNRTYLLSSNFSLLSLLHGNLLWALSKLYVSASSIKCQEYELLPLSSTWSVWVGDRAQWLAIIPLGSVSSFSWGPVSLTCQSLALSRALWQLVKVCLPIWVTQSTQDVMLLAKQGECQWDHNGDEQKQQSSMPGKSHSTAMWTHSPQSWFPVLGLPWLSSGPSTFKWGWFPDPKFLWRITKNKIRKV